MVSLSLSSMTSFVVTMRDLSIYVNYVHFHLSIDKFDGTNYDTCVSDIRLLLKSQEYVDHLT